LGTCRVASHGYSGRSLIIDYFISTSQDDKIVTLGQVSGVIAYFPRYQCKTPTMKTRKITMTKSTMNTWTRRKENLRMSNDFGGIEVLNATFAESTKSIKGEFL
jgi:hypothetical protein